MDRNVFSVDVSIVTPLEQSVTFSWVPLLLRLCRSLVSIEDHQVVGGMGAQLSHALSRAGIAHRVTSLAIPGEFGQSAYVAEIFTRNTA
jgi:transketolase C-terminal domain/subunit